MDSKNVIAAITLSTAVIVLYSLFFIPEQPTTNKNLTENKKIEQNSDTPSLEQKDTLKNISRDEALGQSKRINFENNNIIGSIALKGASIDDLTFKNYKINLGNEKKVTLLGPRNYNEGYLVESGFVTNDKNIDIPNSDTVWSLIGTNKLTNQSPIKLSWTNDQGITFEKLISLDENLFNKTLQNLIDTEGLETTFTHHLIPFLDRIGIMWLIGSINPAQEHLISNLIRQKVISEIDKQIVPDDQLYLLIQNDRSVIIFTDCIDNCAFLISRMF